MACDGITLGDSPDCDNLPPGGTEPFLYLGNHGELDDMGEDADFIITSITLESGGKLYKFEGFRNDVKRSDEVISPGIGSNQFKHVLGWVIYNRSQAVKNQIERLARKRFFAVAPLNGQDANAFEVIGRKAGLEIVVGPLRNAHENGGYWIINMATPEGSFEPKLPQTFMTDYDTAKDTLEALTV
jgi:hypothetical protein